MVEILTSFPGMIHYHHHNLVYGSIFHRIYQSLDGGEHWKLSLTLPIELRWKVSELLPLSGRLFRTGIRHLIPDGDHLVIVGYASVYSYNLKSGIMHPPIRLMGSRPFSVCSGSGYLYYGEYWRNPNRQSIRVMRSSDHGARWNVAYQFSDIRHIHGIFYDPDTAAIWVTTGDEDGESALWNTTDHFRTIHRVLGGSQAFRAVNLLFTREYVYFGSDTGRITNYIYRYSKATGTVEQLQKVNSPVFYGTRVADNLFFSTVCEPSKTNPSRELVIWQSKDGNKWAPWLKFTKDRWPMRLFQYGQLVFPVGGGAHGELWISAIACRDFKGSIKVAIHN